MKIKDALGNILLAPIYPLRIVSVVPSQTELLYDLGLKEEVVGITKFCVHPELWFKTKKRIGGTKNLNLEEIKKLNPTLIIANKEENTKEDIETLSEDFPCYVSDVKTVKDACKMIEQVGILVDKKQEALQLVRQIERAFTNLSKKLAIKNHRPTVLYLIWRNPYMAVGRDTFIHDILDKANLENISQHYTRYPELSEEEIISLSPDKIFLSSEPYPFKEQHKAALSRLCPNADIHLVDGELFSWYGSRLLHTTPYLCNLLEI